MKIAIHMHNCVLNVSRYWCMTALYLLGAGDKIDRPRILGLVRDCHQENGGFSAAPGHDAHVL